MSTPNDGVFDLLRTLAEQGFWGVLTLKFQHGSVIHITKEESIHTNEQEPKYRRKHENISKSN